MRWYCRTRKNATVMNSVPMITCSPWNPVAMKNVDPYAPSAIVNGASTYSYPCRAVNSSARITVAITPSSVPRRLPSISEWCAYVTVAPDDSRRIVFSRGTSYGDSGSIPCGGQCAPSSTVGARALWKTRLCNVVLHIRLYHSVDSNVVVEDDGPADSMV